MTYDLDSLLTTRNANKPRRNRLIRLLRDLPTFAPQLSKQIEDLRIQGKHEWKENDFLWRGIVRAATTVQGGCAYHNIATLPRQTWSFDRAIGVPQNHRATFLQDLIKARKPDNKRVQQMLCNLNRLGSRKKLGQEQRSLRKLSGAHNKVEYFLTVESGTKKFTGFGPKYARNFWLDYSDKDVSCKCFAIDSRIQSVLSVIWPCLDGAEGKKFIKKALSRDHSYKKIESALLDIAKEAGVSAWYADRTLYHLLAKQTQVTVLDWLRNGGARPRMD